MKLLLPLILMSTALA
jgi:hypothetical protein